jgi:hypothetical protein
MFQWVLFWRLSNLPAACSCEYDVSTLIGQFEVRSGCGAVGSMDCSVSSVVAARSVAVSPGGILPPERGRFRLILSIYRCCFLLRSNVSPAI